MKTTKPITNPRLIIAQVLQLVIIKGQSLDKALETCAHALPQESFIKAVSFGVARFYHRLVAIIGLYLSKPLKPKDQDVYLLLLSGVYELLDMHTPSHAVVSETVNATRLLGKPWAAGLVNAMLRNLQRGQANLNTQLESNPSAHYAHPDWFIFAVKKAWPAHWRAILEANNQHPPMCIRVNQLKCSREQYLTKLQAIGLHAQAIPYTHSGIVITPAIAVDVLPGFRSGEVSVQDGAAQFAAELLELEAGQRVLDACAAPGGKTGHILELGVDLQELVAIDIDRKRLERVEQNLARLGLQATLLAADAAEITDWWDGKPFARILLDAPCSGTGVIRRHPDIKLLRREADIPQFAAQQAKLLNALWQTLAPGGILVYITCSIMPEENSELVEQFLHQHADAQEKRLACAYGHPQQIGRQILPTSNGMDGFYYAKLQKKA
jgi:16S rRNA (cytosine967-C5)-methyltransferase